MRASGCAAGEHVGEFREQHGAGINLRVEVRSDGFKEPEWVAAPQERRHHHVGIEDDPHAIGKS